MSTRDVFNNTVFLLGAGASRDVDCMTSANMLDDLKIKINGHHDTKKKQLFSEIYGFLLGSLRFQYALTESEDRRMPALINIEDFVRVLRSIIDRDYIVPAPLVGTWSDKILKWEMHAEGHVFYDLYEFILLQLRTVWTRFNRRKLSNYLRPIRQLLVMSELDKIDFFTLNYDLAFESYFNSDEERLLENGFEHDRWQGAFTDQDIHKESKINLYKLHGSLDWLYNREDEAVELRREIEVPLIIFGTDNKMQSTTPFLELLTRFRDRLSNSRLIITIGYSFYDPYINNILIQELKRTPDKMLIVVDPKYKRGRKESFLQDLSTIQLRKSGTSVPNLSRISPEKVEVLPIIAKAFFKDYFGDSARKLEFLYNQIQEATTPF